MSQIPHANFLLGRYKNSETILSLAEFMHGCELKFLYPRQFQLIKRDLEFAHGLTISPIPTSGFPDISVSLWENRSADVFPDFGCDRCLNFGKEKYCPNYEIMEGRRKSWGICTHYQVTPVASTSGGKKEINMYKKGDKVLTPIGTGQVIDKAKDGTFKIYLNDGEEKDTCQRFNASELHPIREVKKEEEAPLLTAEALKKMKTLAELKKFIQQNGIQCPTKGNVEDVRAALAQEFGIDLAELDEDASDDEVNYETLVTLSDADLLKTVEANELSISGYKKMKRNELILAICEAADIAIPASDDSEDDEDSESDLGEDEEYVDDDGDITGEDEDGSEEDEEEEEEEEDDEDDSEPEPDPEVEKAAKARVIEKKKEASAELKKVAAPKAVVKEAVDEVAKKRDSRSPNRSYSRPVVISPGKYAFEDVAQRLIEIHKQTGDFRLSFFELGVISQRSMVFNNRRAICLGLQRFGYSMLELEGEETAVILKYDPKVAKKVPKNLLPRTK